MKKIFIAILFLMFNFSNSDAQKPQEILGIAKEVKTIAYYQEQGELWKKETEKKPKNGNAHLQYYRARRAFFQLTYPEVWKNNQNEIYNKLQPIIARTKKSMGSSFEYYLIQGENTNAAKAIEFFQKAYEIDPNRKETYGGLMIHYTLTFQENKAKEIARKLLKVNHYSNANLSWNNNTLKTLAKNGVYIANGDMDVLPKWVLQSGENIRNDVLVASRWMMINDKNYRKKVFEKIGLPDFSKSAKDFDSPTDFADETTAYIMKNSPRPVYIGNGTNKKFFKKMRIEENVYLVGLAFLYSKKDFDNLETIRVNFEEKIRMDYLINNFQVHAQDEMVKTHMNLTYLPGLIKMRNYFKKKKNKEKEKKYQIYIEKIAKDSGREQEIMSWFNH